MWPFSPKVTVSDFDIVLGDLVPDLAEVYDILSNLEIISKRRKISSVYIERDMDRASYWLISTINSESSIMTRRLAGSGCSFSFVIMKSTKLSALAIFFRLKSSDAEGWTQYSSYVQRVGGDTFITSE